MAFITPTGHYEYLVRPPQRFLHRFVIVYIDDILIFSRFESEHPQYVMRVLQRPHEFQLFLKAEKCSFYQKSVKFLGYIIDQIDLILDKQGESLHHFHLACTNHNQRASAISGFCKFLQEISALPQSSYIQIQNSCLW